MHCVFSNSSSVQTVGITLKGTEQIMKVLIADDEAVVLEGLKYIIDWDELGFSICSQASNGEETLNKILNLRPDLVLLDIRMPRMTGIEIIQTARENGFSGHFIILSGYSDFTYAQTAIRYGVDFYLTKPIDEDELISAVTSVRNSIESERREKDNFNRYRENALDTILRNLLVGDVSDISPTTQRDLHLSAEVYQVIIYERYNQDSFQTFWNFAELLRVTNQDHNSFDHIILDKREVFLLKGAFAAERFDALLHHYDVNPQKGSPLDSLFLTYGRRVYRLEDVCLSYQDASTLLSRRFFCEPNQHVLGYQALPAQDLPLLPQESWNEQAPEYSRRLTDYIQTQNRTRIAETLRELESELYRTAAEIPAIKRYLIDIYLQIKQNLTHSYSNMDIPFSSNAEIIGFIEKQYYLYEILQFFSEHFEMCMNAIGSPTSKTIIEDILYYIDHNYRENLKLETIAPLFGYNSSYLGKIFTREVGETFNSYLDRIRIRHSQELLSDRALKVYEVAEKVGYKNVDYFHKKFKKLVGESPAEYRKKL